MSIRILCTGSRAWTDEPLIRRTLEALSPEFAWPENSEICVVHGGCPEGADAIVDKVARQLGYTVEVHPADTKRHGSPFAFYVRNQHMVSRGPYALCLAFWCPGGPVDTQRNAMSRADGRGTADTFTRAAMAGIAVRICVEGARR